MGLFHKYLKDALKALEKGDEKEYFKICKEHANKHVILQTNGIMYRLQHNLRLYNENLIWLSGGHSTWNKEEAKLKLEDSIKRLSRIKKDIKKLLETERVKLE